MRGAFLDSNILIYAFDADEQRMPLARDLLQKGAVVSIQSLNEFTHVARRKLRFDWAEVQLALTAIQALVPTIVPLTLSVHRDGLRLAERYLLSVYDGLIVAAALEARCDILYTEDMHAGLVVDGRLTIINPFA